MGTMALLFNGTCPMGQFLGDTIVSIKVAHLFAESVPCERYLLALSPRGELNFLWSAFIRKYNAQVIYDSFDPGNFDARVAFWDKCRKERKIDGVPFDHYRELYRRIDGGNRQGKICGREVGLGKRNVFEYLYVGQEESTPIEGIDSFDSNLIDYKLFPPERDVLIAPYAKCQGNGTFTFGFWEKVVRQLIGGGVSVTVNHNGVFCEDMGRNPLYRRVFPSFEGLRDLVCKHRLVACGNTGVGWMAGATGTPLLAMQPHDSNMQDYRYEWCGLKSLVEFVEEPDVDYVVQRISEEVEKRVVLTTGCFDLLHAGHIRHLEESRSLGTRLVVALNSDSSVQKLKGGDRPIQKQEERATVLRALRSVDEVRIFDGDDAFDLIRTLRPFCLTNGADHKVEEIVGKEFVESYGGKVCVTSGTRTSSTTRTVEKIVKAQDVLKAIRDAGHLTPNPFHKLKLLADQFMSVKHLLGEVADVGTYRGGSAYIMRKLAPEKMLHCFDTWAGNPHSDPMCHHEKGEWPADLSECKRVVGTDAKTAYHQGVFPLTAAELEDRRFCFVYLDGDTYQTTKAALEWFWPRMVTGGKIVIDDVPWLPCAGTEKALDELFTREKQQRFPEACACVLVK